MNYLQEGQIIFCLPVEDGQSMVDISDPKPLKKVSWDLASVTKNDQFLKLRQDDQWGVEKAHPDWILAQKPIQLWPNILKYYLCAIRSLSELFPSSTFSCLFAGTNNFFSGQNFSDQIFSFFAKQIKLQELTCAHLFCLIFICCSLTIPHCLVFAGSLGILLGIS